MQSRVKNMGDLGGLDPCPFAAKEEQCTFS